MYDIVIKNGTIIDGSGAPGYCGDVAVQNGKIATIGQIAEAGTLTIDATGLTVTPGFIDSHSHSDRTLLSFPLQAEKAEQGITTSIAGQCGSSPYPVADPYKTMGDYLDDVRETAQGSNIALFVGHRNLRKTVMGLENRTPTEKELEEMKALLRDALDHGAFGLSFGLIYTPSCYAQTEELIALAKVVGEYGRVVSAHIRNEADGLVEAVEEFLTVVKEAGVRGVLSHHKAMFSTNHGAVQKTLRMIEEANRNGADVYCDAYPYIASSTSLSARFIPKEYRNERLQEYLADPRWCCDIKRQNQEKWDDDLEWVLIVKCDGASEYEGKRISEIAAARGTDHHEAVLHLLRVSKDRCNAVFFAMCEADVEAVLRYERTMICTDSASATEKSVYHPRLRGSFPRVLGRYVRERGVTSLPEMIRKMTSLPAVVYQLENKGLIKQGYDADLCIFDAAKILDGADFMDCHQRAEGLHYVLVNGRVAVENAVHLPEMAGRVLIKK